LEIDVSKIFWKGPKEKLRYWMGYIKSGWNRDSVVGVVNRLRAGQLRSRGLVPDSNISTPNLSELPWGPSRLPKTDIEDSA
jgi:hypothetical protein